MWLIPPKVSIPPGLVTAKVAKQWIRNGEAPADMRVAGPLGFSGDLSLTELPPGLNVVSLDLSGCRNLRALPPGLRVRRLNLGGDWDPHRLLKDLSCFELDLKGSAILELPASVRVEYRLDLDGCASLRALPDNFKVGTLVLRDCTALEALPEGLDVCFLDVSGCTRLVRWPERARVRLGRFSARGCTQLTSLPPWVTGIAQLDLRDCANLRALPDGLEVGSWIDVAGTGIRSLPPSLRGVRLRWRGVFIDERVAFRPETITPDEVLNEANAEVRRVLLERVGYERFLAEAHAEVLDRDRDAGGERRLLKVDMGRDEPLVCVSVFCPSTGRQYVLRVPPAVQTCHQAAAWIAGFNDPTLYKPLAET